MAQKNHFKLVKPAYPAERVDSWAHSLEDPTVEQSTIERRGQSGAENIAMAQAQLKEKQKDLRGFIEQTNADEGAEVLRRDYEREKVYDDNVNNKSVDKSEESGIIKEIEETREFEPLPPEKVVPVLRKDSEEWINNLSSEEVRVVKKYTKNSGDPDDDKFFARLNAMLRGDIPEDETLNYYSSVISGAISKFELQHDIVCYRAVEFNPVEGLKVGDVYKPKQFLSSSVSTAGALNGKYFLKIFAPKGSKGAYIELLSKYPKKREFLFDKDLNYNVLAVNGNIITVEAIV